jgi:predicted RNase H-like HicB family nuclease
MMTMARQKRKDLELVFLVEEDPEGGFTARALGEAIFTQADDLDALRRNIRDAVECHFGDAADRPRIVRLHQVRDEVMAV